MQICATEILLRCELADPVDGTCRILMLLARCGIGLRGLVLEPAEDGAFHAALRLAGPLPLPAANLRDRLLAIPGILASGQATGAGDRCKHRQAPVLSVPPLKGNRP